MIHVIATIELMPGSRDEFLAEFHQVVPLAHKEQGCLGYGPTVDLPTDIPAQPDARDDVVTVVESWENLEALRAHLAAPHMTAYRQRVKHMLAGVTIHVLQPV